MENAMDAGLVVAGETRLARPLKVLIPLIKEKLKEGDEAAARAGSEYYFQAGSYLNEAYVGEEWFDPSLSISKADQWNRWTEETFHRQPRTIREWRQAANQIDGDRQVVKMLVDSGGQRAAALQPLKFKTLSEATQPSRDPSHKPVWFKPVSEAVKGFDPEPAIRAYQDKFAENKAIKKLALQLIDIGFKALATKLHPDKGNTSFGMRRLNEVRRALQTFTENQWKTK